MRALQRAVAAVVFAIVLVAMPQSASAHAVVVSSSPNDGASLPAAPTEVRLQFSEAVSIELGGLRVVDNQGQRVDTGDALATGDPLVIAARLNAGLGEGTYVASYRVVSADGHPITGAITFGVGDAATRVDGAALPGAGDRLSETLGWASRWLVYGGGLLATGVAVFSLFLFDGGGERRKLAKVIVVSSVVAVVGIVGLVSTHAALATGQGLGALADGSLWSPVFGNNLGWAVAALVLGVGAAVAATNVREELVGQTLAFYGLLSVAISFAVWGHTVEGSLPGVKIGFDAVHAVAAGIWLGGLTGLAIVLAARGRAGADDADPRLVAVAVASSGTGQDPPITPEPSVNAAERLSPQSNDASSTALVVSRFSLVAALSVASLAISGVFLAWQELGSLSALRSTVYGRTLTVKLVLVGAVIAIAAYNRFRLVPKTLAAVEDAAPTADEPMRRMLSTVRYEALGILAVLAVTAVLVNTIPGRAQSTMVGPFDQTVAMGAVQANVGVTPAQAGPNQVHITFLDSGGQPIAAAQNVQVSFTQTQAGVGPLSRAMVPAGTGHYVLDTKDLAIPGTWQVEFLVRLGDFEQERLTFQVPVGG
jgi:copper transport protein